ncbi:S8 family serine peptidase [Fictibacillus barbaricus]|uniref:S8 family serine peptidase n=1 Tax=Fictibacillus barbaricus TaxID=182136 RepID=A0ABS2Z950_9BACL|nr:S8 family serine peptidase [Fictibacillus barbaricus]MBN3544122.1 S8 family serine peptidase [Fictibacillus barbaricus]GGB69120.1 peptidase S8 [Fictibacillus barbaricus]
MTKQKMSNTRKRFAVMCLSSSIVLSQFTGLLSNPYSSKVAHAQSKVTTEKILANLTYEQRTAFMELQTTQVTGLHLSPKVNLKSTDEISVIVEFKQRPHKIAVIEAAIEGKSLSVTEAKNQVDVSHDTFKKDLEVILASKEAKDASSYKVKRSYKNAFNGVAMKLPANQVQSLLQSKAVKAIYSDLKVQVEPPVEVKNSDASQMGLGMADERSHLQIDKLHEEGFTGKGVKVGVIDTGIDYNHPDLKGAFKGGYDFVDNDADPMETTYEDWVKAGKPYNSSYMTTHGTHVSGTIAGQGKNNNNYATTGVAPDAELYAYRVLGPYGSGEFSSVMAGMEKAMEDGMDVINMSLGVNQNDPMNPVSMALNNTVLSGITAVVSAGNSGSGMYTLGYPGAAALALTVGASNVPRTIPQYHGSLAAGEKTVTVDLRLLAFGFGDDITKFKGQTLPVVYTGIGSEKDFENKNVEGKIALIVHGDIALQSKIVNAKQNGAAAVLIYNIDQDEGHIPYYLAEGRDYIPAYSLTYADGIALKQHVEAGHTNFTFGEMTELKTQGDILADFSSRGPSSTNIDIKPEVTAPGVAVLSTIASDVINGNQGDNYQYAYHRLSGTSMAAPHVAGTAALLLQANPNLQPEEVKSILMNTADPLSKPYSVFEVGAGRVDPYEAIHSDVVISVKDSTPLIENGKEKRINEKTGSISFGYHLYSGKDIADSRTVILTNNGNTAKTFDVKVHFQSDLRGSKDAAKNGVKVQTDTTIELKGNDQKKANVSLYLPKNAELGIYEGYVVYTNKDNPSETYQVPFGFSYEEAGFNYFKFEQHAMTSTIYPEPSNFKRMATGYRLSLKSHVKRIDFMIIDPETNEYIGSLNAIDGKNIEPNKDLSLGTMGFYHPFIGNQKKPSSSDINDLISSLANRLDTIKPGKYKIKAIATNDNGETFSSNEEVLFIDNTAPEFKLDLPNGVYEYEAGQKSVSFSGSIYDNIINDMKAAGLDVSQANNKVWYLYNNAFHHPADSVMVSLNQDGTFSGSIPMDESIPILPVNFNAQSISDAGDYPKMLSTYFVKKGTQYVSAKPNKEEQKMGESVTYTLTMHNANMLKNQTLTFDYLSDHFEIENIAVHQDLQKKAAVELKEEELQGDGTYKKHRIHVTVKDGVQSINGTIPVVDVTFKVKDEQYYDGELNLENLTSSYINTDEETVSIPSVSIESYVIPTFSEVIIAGLEQGLPLDVDYTKAGVTASVTDENNKQYKGIVVNNGGYLYVKFPKLPVTSKELMYHIHVPGEFDISYPFTVFKQDGETIRGESDVQFFGLIYAGDVNDDQVIDIKDAIYMKQHWGTNTRSADINYDGVVDMNDFAFIENNFLLVNDTATNPPNPQERFKGQTLESIKKELEGN